MFSCTFKRFKISFTRGTIARKVWYPRVQDKDVDVVLLKDDNQLGPAGKIIKVRRGFANHNLIPNGIAVIANWQNVDLYANPNLNIPKTELEKSDGNAQLNIENQQFINFGGNYKLEIQVRTFAKQPNLLCDPISIFQVLDQLANEHEIDLVPSDIDQILKIEHGKKENMGRACTFFDNVGMFEIWAKFPLVEYPDNRIAFRVNITALEGTAKARFVSEIQHVISAVRTNKFNLKLHPRID